MTDRSVKSCHNLIESFGGDKAESLNLNFSNHLGDPFWPSPWQGGLQYCRFLNLSHPSVHEEFDSRDVTALIGSEKCYSFGNLFRMAETSQWNCARKRFDPLLTDFRGTNKLTKTGSIC